MDKNFIEDVKMYQELGCKLGIVAQTRWVQLNFEKFVELVKYFNSKFSVEYCKVYKYPYSLTTIIDDIEFVCLCTNEEFSKADWRPLNESEKIS